MCATKHVQIDSDKAIAVDANEREFSRGTSAIFVRLGFPLMMRSLCKPFVQGFLAQNDIVI